MYHIRLIIEDNELVYQCRMAADHQAPWTPFTADIVSSNPAFHHLIRFDFAQFLSVFLGGQIEDGQYGHMPKLDAFRHELVNLPNELSKLRQSSSDLIRLEDGPILQITESVFQLSHALLVIKKGPIFSALATHEVCRFFNALQTRKVQGTDVTDLAEVEYMRGSVFLSLKDRKVVGTEPSFSGWVEIRGDEPEKLNWDDQENTPNPFWMAGMEDAVSTVETFALIEGEGAEAFKKNLLMRLKDKLKPTYITPAKYTPEQNRQMIDALTAIHTRLGNAGVKAIDSHAISMIIAECENALPILTKGPTW